MAKQHHSRAVITGPGQFRLETVETLPPGPRQVRVRLEGCGVCGSNLPVWEGRPWFQYPLEAGAPGHEGWGVVDEAGAEVAGLQAGQRVALLTHHAFAEMETADADQVIPLPATLDGLDFPGEALGCAINVFRRAGIGAGQTVAIIGIGFMGALLTQLAKGAGATVIALSRRAASLEMARRMGADCVIPLEDHDAIIEEVKGLTTGRFCERVIEATGWQWPLDLAAELSAERGRLIIAGYHQDGPRQVNMQLWNWRGLDVINAHERDPLVYVEGIHMAMGAVAEGRLNPAPLYTHRFRLEELGKALDLLGKREAGFMKALVTYD